MKKVVPFLTSLLLLLNFGMYSQKVIAKKDTKAKQTDIFKKTELLKTNYYSFQSDPHLNAHLYLYNRSIGCKYKKVHNDSLAYYSFKDKSKLLTNEDLSILNSVIVFYRDSLISKDLLFDSLMRDFTDHISKSTVPQVRWQIAALEQLKKFQPYFNKLYWKEIDESNKIWINANKNQIKKMELTIVPTLAKIYQTKLPEIEIQIDLTCYATWAGAYSFNNTFCHVLLASNNGSNKGDLAPEVVFHETSHFLVGKLEMEIEKTAQKIDIRKTINLWHNIIFYTTGSVVENYYAAEGKMFFPFYVQMKFEDKFPDFKATVEACKLYWDPYIDGAASFEDGVKNCVNYVLEKK